MSLVPKYFKETLSVRAFALLKVPLLASVRPTILDSTSERIEVKIPLNRWTRNHLKSMYFGTLAIGADSAVGLMAFKQIQASKSKISLVFKNFQTEFLKRPEGDVHFICEAGAQINEMIKRCIDTQERVTEPITAYAVVPTLSDEPVATFTLGLSLKLQNPSK